MGSITLGTVSVTSISSDASITISSSTTDVRIGNYTFPAALPSQDSVLVSSETGVLSFVPVNVRAEVASATYTISANDSVVAVTVAQGMTLLTLPDPSTKVVGDIIHVRKEVAGTDTVTILPNVAESISGQASYSITSEYGSVSLYTNGTAWFILP